MSKIVNLALVNGDIASDFLNAVTLLRLVVSMWVFNEQGDNYRAGRECGLACASGVLDL